MRPDLRRDRELHRLRLRLGRPVEARSRSLGTDVVAVRGPWIRAGTAAAAVMRMPVLHSWTVERLEHTHKALHQGSTEALARSFTPEEPVTRNGAIRRGADLGSASAAGKAAVITAEATGSLP